MGLHQFRFAFAVSAAIGLLSAPVQAAPDCTPGALQGLAPPGVQIQSAHIETTGGAAYCQVEATMPTSNNTLRLRLGLPQAWNGKFLFEAVGGGDGVLVEVWHGTQRGYAVATTDDGHVSEQVSNLDFWLKPEQRTDWIYRGVHAATGASKALVQSYYARAPERSYLRGCSNGGRAGLVEAERFPADYDGIISGAPAVNPGYSALDWIWDAQVVTTAPERLSADDWKLAARTVRAECDAKDGLADGIIQDPRRCELPRARLACAPDQQGACLDAAKMDTLDKLWHKTRLADGRPLFEEGHGYEDSMPSWIFFARATPLDLLEAMTASSNKKGNELGSRSPEPAPPWSVMLPMLFTGSPAALDLIGGAFGRGILMPPGETIDVHTFDVVRQGGPLAERINQVMGASEHPDLSAYLGHGSKLLIWHGLGDVTLAPAATLDYYERVRDDALKSGMQAQAFDQAVRLYPVPTLGHCGGDNGPNEGDLLGTLDAWVAQNHIPEAIPVTQRKADGSVARSRILCPMPEEPHYSGHGSVDEASSFVCAVPPDRVGMTGIAQPAH